MANRFSYNAKMSERDMLESRYRSTRINLLVVALFTLINIVFVALGSDTYMLFSATVPYLIAYLSAYLCCMLPPQYYEGDLAGFEPLPEGVFYVALAVSVVIIALYVLAFFFSKKGRVGWLIFALVFFSIDTLVLFGYFGIDVAMLLDYLFHAWIIVILAMGIHAHFKLKKLPEEKITEEELESEEDAPADSTPLRIADMSVKAKVFLEADANGRHVVYRRVKRTNELVINGQVYDEYEALIEGPHTLVAVLDGHVYTAGCNNASQAFIDVDEQRVAKKIRLI